MSSSSSSLCSPSSKNSSLASTKLERRSRLSPFSLENFRSLINSARYDCKAYVASVFRPSDIEFIRQTYPEFGEPVSSLPDPLDGCPLEEPLWTEQPDKNSGAEDFYGPFE